MPVETLTKPEPRVEEAQGFELVWPAVREIDGWLSREQAAALYDAAGAVAPGQWIVELGSHHGRSTVALARGKSPSARLLAVDPYPQPPFGQGEAAYEAFRSNLRQAGVDGEVDLFRGTGKRAAESFRLLTDALSEPDGGATSEFRRIPIGGPGTAKIGLLFVDGLHDRSSVLDDISCWEPLVAEGGLVCFHDAFFRLGVTLALLERHTMNTRFRYLESVGNLAIFRREYVGTREAVVGSLRLMARLRYFLRNMIVTIAVRRNWRWLQRLLPPEEDFEY